MFMNDDGMGTSGLHWVMLPGFKWYIVGPISGSDCHASILESAWPNKVRLGLGLVSLCQGNLTSHPAL